MENYAQVDLVGVGLNATDTMISLSAFPALGSKIEFHNPSILPGGQVATAVLACQRWGLRTRYVGKMGDDRAAGIHHEEFRRAGVEMQICSVAGADSPQSLILVDPSGERTVLCRRDDRLILRPEDLKREWIASARALHLDGHDTEAAIVAARWAHEAGIPVIADLDEAYPGIEELAGLIDYLIASRDFPPKLVGEEDLRESLPALGEQFGCRLVAATLGPDGVLGWEQGSFHYAPAFSVPVVDTTGAGDIFHAGFIYALLAGWPLGRRLDFACAAAALNCMAAGARGGIRDLAAIEALMDTGNRYQPLYQKRGAELAPSLE